VISEALYSTTLFALFLENLRDFLENFFASIGTQDPHQRKCLFIQNTTQPSSLFYTAFSVHVNFHLSEKVSVSLCTPKADRLHLNWRNSTTTTQRKAALF
jgi:hypothetical protein